jgi:hypothetical protein
METEIHRRAPRHIDGFHRGEGAKFTFSTIVSGVSTRISAAALARQRLAYLAQNLHPLRVIAKHQHRADAGLVHGVETIGLHQLRERLRIGLAFGFIGERHSHGEASPDLEPRLIRDPVVEVAAFRPCAPSARRLS